MINDPESLIPQNKFDTNRAEAAVAAGYPTVAPILPQLLEWLQDYNWPVARILAPFLASIGVPLIPHIRHIMGTDDDMWKYWIMDLVMSKSPDVAAAFRGDIERIAYSPTEREIIEILDQKAQETLAIYEWQRASS